MYEELTRKMNAEERAILARRAAKTDPPVTLLGTTKWVLVWTTGMILCALVWIALFLLDVNPVVFGIVFGPFALASIICLYAIIVMIGGHFRWTGYHRDFLRDTLPRIDAALKSGKAFVKKVSATAVIEIVAFEDEVSGYIYDVGDGKTLFLKGQRFYPVSNDMPWPNSDFEIVESVDRNLWIGIFCSGHELTPVREIETEDCIDEIVWADREELLDGTIEEFAASIMKGAK